jgi:hypothetical protein
MASHKDRIDIAYGVSLSPIALIIMGCIAVIGGAALVALLIAP